MKKTLAFYSILFVGFLLVQRGAGVLAKIVLANSISPYEYGLITLIAVTIPSILQLFSNLNFYQILSHSTEGKEYFRFSIVVTAALMFIISMFMIIFSDQFFAYLNVPTEQKSLYLLVIMMTMWSTGILVDFQGYFTGLKNYALPGFILTLPSIIRLIAIIGLMMISTIDMNTVLLIFGISSLVPLLYLFVEGEYRSLFDLRGTIKIPDKKILAFGTTIFIVSSFPAIGQYLIKIVVSHQLGLEWQGYFDVSLTLISLVAFGLSTIGYVSVPEATTSDKKVIYQKGGLVDIARLFFAFSLITTIVIFFYADYIIILLFSSDYLPAADYVVILAIGYLFLFIQSYIANINLAHARRMKDYSLYLIPPLLFIPLFFFMTQLSIGILKETGLGNGFLGAYLTFTLNLILLTLVTLIFSDNFEPIKSLLKKSEGLVISLIIPSIVIAFFHPEPIIGIIILTGTFSLLAFLSGYLDKSIILEIFSKK